MKVGIGSLVLKMTGWTFEGELPEPLRCVLIAAPHTSNWDFVYMMAMAWHLDLRLSWMGKAPLFRPPHGPFFHWLGGIPIERDVRMNLVQQCAARFAERDKLVLAVPAEGMRARTEYWRSGFYHIAREAGVPIVLGYLDYRCKRGGLGPAIYPSGNIAADMDCIRAFYADKTGRYPDEFGVPRLMDEAGVARRGHAPSP